MSQSDIEELLAATNHRAALVNQIEHAKQRFRATNVLFWEGHAFDLSYGFIEYVERHREDESVILLDRKEEPVLIEDIEEFFDSALEAHAEALNDYYDTYSRLMKAKTAAEVIEAA